MQRRFTGAAAPSRAWPMPCGLPSAVSGTCGLRTAAARPGPNHRARNCRASPLQSFTSRCTPPPSEAVSLARLEGIISSVKPAHVPHTVEVLPRLFLPPTIPEEQAVLICGDCSARNDDGENFCTNCGAYLEWQRPPAGAVDRPQAATSGPGPKAPPDTAELPQITVPPVRTAGEPRPGTPHGRRSAAAGNENPGRSGTVRAGGAGGARQGTGPESDGDVRAKSDPVAVIDIEPAAVKPGQRISSAPRVIPADREASTAAGELICATCGTGNQTDRSFCRRCAASLAVEPVAEVSVAPRLSWWRRLFRQPRGKHCRRAPGPDRSQGVSRRDPQLWLRCWGCWAAGPTPTATRLEVRLSGSWTNFSIVRWSQQK